MSASTFENKTLAVMLGGTAAERAISLKSGENVACCIGGLLALSVLRVDPAEPGLARNILKEAGIRLQLCYMDLAERTVAVQGLLELDEACHTAGAACWHLLSRWTRCEPSSLWQGAGLITPRSSVVLKPDCDWQAVIDELGRGVCEAGFGRVRHWE